MRVFLGDFQLEKINQLNQGRWDLLFLTSNCKSISIASLFYLFFMHLMISEICLLVPRNCFKFNQFFFIIKPNWDLSLIKGNSLQLGCSLKCSHVGSHEAKEVVHVPSVICSPNTVLESWERMKTGGQGWGGGGETRKGRRRWTNQHTRRRLSLGF